MMKPKVKPWTGLHVTNEFCGMFQQGKPPQKKNFPKHVNFALTNHRITTGQEISAPDHVTSGSALCYSLSWGFVRKCRSRPISLCFQPNRQEMTLKISHNLINDSVKF